VRAPRSHHSQRTELERIARRVMVERGFRTDFSPAVAKQLAALEPVLAQDVRDLRELPWISIDNDDSRDLDQLTAAERRDAGAMRISVAVADVASTVPPGSPIDDHARNNTTSVYTVPQVFPMLPLELSWDKTSLNEDSERLAVVIELVIDARGELGPSDVYRARVRNQAKLAYPSVAAWLEGNAPAPEPLRRDPGLAEQVRLQDEIAQALEQRRRQEGALDFETRTPHAIYEDGRVTGIALATSNRATKLIENFMIAANGVTARFLSEHGPVIQRIVRRPKNWPRLREVAAELAEELPQQPDNVALSRFLARRRRAAPQTFADLSLVVIKLLGRGEYVVGGEHGHFGLAVRDYSHSTAPNRRLSDLVTQRLLLAALSGQARPYDTEELRSIAARCTDKEADAEKVERHVRKSAAALFLQDRVGERFDSIVTGDSDKGTWVRIEDPPVEGMLVRGAEGVRVGERVSVELTAVDVERGHINFEAV